MSACHFCKDDIYESKEYRITSPEGKELFLCDICMADITTFFKSGRAEDIKLRDYDETAPRRRLHILKTGGKIFFAEKTSFGIREFRNVEINDISKTRGFKYDPNAITYGPDPFGRQHETIMLDINAKSCDIEVI